jgi:hypothetical protein
MFCKHLLAEGIAFYESYGLEASPMSGQVDSAYTAEK